MLQAIKNWSVITGHQCLSHLQYVNHKDLPLTSMQGHHDAPGVAAWFLRVQYPVDSFETDKLSFHVQCRQA